MHFLIRAGVFDIKGGNFFAQQEIRHRCRFHEYKNLSIRAGNARQ